MNKSTKCTEYAEKEDQKQNNCNACNEVFSDGDRMVNCEACELWNCRDYAGLTVPAGYKILQNNKHMHYFCEDCNDDAMSTVKTKFKVFIESTCKQCIFIQVCLHRWLRGRVHACHSGDPGLFPGRCRHI